MTNKKKIIIWICFVLVLFSVFPAYKFYEIYNHIANTFLCDKAIVVFESDDWGMCGVRDIETFDFLIQSGVPLDDDPWGYYSLETVYDLEKLYQILSKHRDVSGQHPVFTCNFIVANPDFEKIQNGGYENYFYKSLSEGLPSKWERGNLYQKYMEGIDKGLIYPGFHGREHFNEEIWLRLLRANDKLATALFKEQMMFGMSKLWEKIHGSYFIPPSDFRSSESQRENIHDGVRIFTELFHMDPLTTSAPGYLWNDKTEDIWNDMGIRVIQAGNRQQSGISSEGKVIREKFRHLGEMNDLGMVYLIRNYDFEPWLFPQNLDVYLDEIDVYVQRGEPVVISSHSVNYISSIKDFRSVSLPILDDLLSALVSKYNHLYFLNSAQLGQAISEGFFITSDGQTVELKQRKSFYHDLKSTLIHILYKIKHKL